MSDIKNLSRMGIFARVVDAGSFTGAAELLAMSKGAVSKQVTALEDSLGIRLLQRNARHFCLTHEGQLFYRHCKQALDGLLELESAAEMMKEEPEGSVVIDVPPLMAKYFLVNRLSDFFKQYPHINLDMRLQDSEIKHLAEGIDIAVIIDDIADSSANCRRLGSIVSVPCASPAYLKKRGTPKAPQDLTQHNCMVMKYHNMPKANDWVFYKAGKRSHLKVSGNLDISSTQLMNDMLLQGQGIALQPLFSIQNQLASGELVQVLPDYTGPEIPFYLAFMERKNISPKLRVTIDFLVDCFSPLRAPH